MLRKLERLTIQTFNSIVASQKKKNDIIQYITYIFSVVNGKLNLQWNYLDNTRKKKHLIFPEYDMFFLETNLKMVLVGVLKKKFSSVWFFVKWSIYEWTKPWKIVECFLERSGLLSPLVQT